MTTDAEWHEWRSKGLGGSDVAAVLGLSPWSSPYSLWAEKVGLVPRDPSTSEAQEAGKMLEVALTPWFEARHPDMRVTGQQQQCEHPEKPWMRCTIDGKVHEAITRADYLIAVRAGMAPPPLGVAEWKVTQDTAESWAEQVPDYYACQATWNMLVTGTDRCWFGVLHTAFGRLKFRTYEFVLHEGDARFVAERCERFWMEHVVTGEPPAVDAHEATHDALNAQWPDAAKNSMDATDELLALVAERDQWVQTQDAAEEQVERLSNRIREAMGDHTEIRHNGKNLVTWRWGKGRSDLDAKAIRLNHPELAALYRKPPTPTRTLRVNPPKEISK